MNNEKKQNKKQKKHKRSIPVLTVTVVCVLVFCILSAVFGALQLSSLESGIIDVCAVQQDAYVQMVIDQINIKENRSNEEIISDILGTMDASTNKYWTFSNDQTMLFVKDVLETNKYKGFTTSTYYSSQSAEDFLNTLKVNRVTHSNITIEGKDYVASGSAFEYNGNLYKLCLLSNKSVFLDNNKYLSAKTNLQILIIALLAVLALTALIFAQKLRTLKKQLASEKENSAVLARGLTKMNEIYSERDLHSTGNNLWRRSSLDGFLDKLKERKVSPVTLITVKCDSKQAYDSMLERAHVMLDRKVLYFDAGENAVTFLFIECAVDNAESAVKPLLTDSARISEILYSKDGNGEFENTDIN